MFKPKKRIIIVGAGIIGASIAWHLVRRGLEVTVIEKDEPAAGATGSAFGWITSAVSDDAPDMPLRRAAVTDWHRLEEDIPELRINWTGSLKYTSESGNNLPGEVILQRPAISHLEPALGSPPSEARYTEKDGAIEAGEATRVLLNKACALGAVLKTQTSVTGIIREEGRITGVFTSQGKLDADCVVLACGTGIPALTEMAGIRVPVLASPAILLRFALPLRIINTLLSGDDLEVRHARNGDLLAAEDYSSINSVSNIAHEAQIAIKNRLKGSQAASLIGYSVGERPVLQDGYPVIGFVDEAEGIYVAVMHPAVTCAATIGRLVSAELTTGLSHEIPACYRPTRFSVSASMGGDTTKKCT